MENTLTTCTHSIEESTAAKLREPLVTFIRKTYEALKLMRAVRNERLALAQLSEADLRDIGISRVDARIESARSILDLPQHRLGR